MNDLFYESSTIYQGEDESKVLDEKKPLNEDKAEETSKADPSQNTIHEEQKKRKNFLDAMYKK